MKHYRSLLSFSTALLLSTTPTHVQASDISAGLNVGLFGTGAYVAGDTGWSFGEEDKIRWRASLSKIDESVKNERVSDNKYSGDIKSTGGKIGLDWYPFTNQFFVSGGVASFDREFDLKITPQKDFTIGNQQVVVADKVGLKTKLDHSSIVPYVSIGLGNRSKIESGFAIFGEVGVMFPTDDADVSLSLTGNNGIVSNEDIAIERRDIEDDLNKAQLVATFGIGYHF